MPTAGPEFFDAMTHPTLDGRWLGGKPGLTFDALREYLDSGQLAGACAVALPGIGGYAHQQYFDAASTIPGLIAVAALTTLEPVALNTELDQVAGIGFRAVKIHPRLLKQHPSGGELGAVLRAIHARGLAAMYCSYYFEPVGQMPGEDPYWQLVRALNEVPDISLIIAHGGGVRLLEYAELVRFSPRLLLDVSLTIMKYRGSSIDSDLAFLFRSFDRRVCVGTDIPDWPFEDVQRVIAEATSTLSAEKSANILHVNIEQFFGL